MDDLEFRGFVVAAHLDKEYEVRVTTENGESLCWLNESESEDLVDHLIAVFGLKYKKEEPSEK